MGLNTPILFQGFVVDLVASPSSATTEFPLAEAMLLIGNASVLAPVVKLLDKIKLQPKSGRPLFRYQEQGAEGAAMPYEQD